MVRTAAQLQQEGARVVILDLTAVGTNLTPEQWYFTLLSQLGEGLNCEAEMEALWDGNPQLSPLARWMMVLREVAVRRSEQPVVIFVDEIDYVRSLPFAADEFFAAIRECYNLRTRDARMRGLSFCLLGVAMPADLIQDPRMTPFNIGRAMNLADFSPAEAEPLAVGLHPDLDAGQRLIQRVIHWTGGQPYLTQKLCAEVRKAQAGTPVAVDEVCERVFLSPHAREHDDNLHLVQERMLRSNLDRAALLDIYAQVCRGARVVDDDLNSLVNELRLSGIVRVVDGHLHIRNEIYRRVFDLRWAEEKLPGGEMRRQRAAFYRGVRRAAVAAAAVTIVVSLLAVYAWKQKRIALRADPRRQRQRPACRKERGASDRTQTHRR